MRPFTRAGLRHLFRHGGQLALTVLGVTLGVAVFVAMDLGIQSAREAFRVSSETIAGRATHQVTRGAAGVPDSLVAVLRRRSEVEAAAPVVEAFVTSPVLEGRALRLLGIDPLSEAPFRGYLATGGSGPSLLVEPRAVILSRSTADAANVELGDAIPIRRGIDERELQVVGILDPVDERSRRGLADLLVMDIAEAQDFLARDGTLDRIDLRLEPTAEGDPRERVTSPLAGVLPAGVRLEGVGTRERTMSEMIRAFDLNLMALSLLGLVFGFFLVYNTMTFSVVQRRRTIGLFRVLGTSRSRVLRGILLEAAALGAAGSILGVLAGIVLGRGLVRLVGRTINDLYFTLSVESLALPPESLLKGLALGVGATLLAAIPPAREAARVGASEAIRRSSVEELARRNVMRAGVAGGTLAGLGGGVLAVSGQGIVAAFVGLFAIIVGMALLTPICTVGAMHLLRPLLKRTVGVLGGMAARGVVTALSRTAPAMAALVIAVSVTIGLGIMIGSFRSSVEDWLEATLQADLYVSAPSTASARISGELPRALSGRIRVLPGVAGVSENRVRELGTEYPGVTLSALALADVDSSDGGFQLLETMGRETIGRDTMDRFRAGEGAIISEPFAFRYGLTPGDTLELSAEAGRFGTPVLAIFRDYASESGAVVLSQAQYERHWSDDAVTALAVFLELGASEQEVEEAVRAAVPPGGAVQVRSNRALRALSLEVFDRTFAITRVLRLLAFLVAFIGVLSALMALQLEREREFGVLRAVGMTPRQTWGLITGQTCIMGVVAGILALPVGVVLAAVMIFVVNRRSFGWSVGMELDPVVLWQGVVLAFVGAVLAGIVPSRRIAGTSPAAALRGE